MKLTRAIEKAVYFAAWCKRHDVEPRDAGELCVLNDRCRRCFEHDDRERGQKLMTKIVTKALMTKRFKDVKWHGLNATFIDLEGRQVDVPF